MEGNILLFASSGVQATFKQVAVASLNAVLGQVQSLSNCEAQPATTAASVRQRFCKTRLISTEV